jgi:hypothetical protein
MVIVLIAWVTPLFLIIRLLIAVTALAIIGLVRDRNKIFSGLAIGIGLGLYFLRYQHELGGDKLDNQRYEVRYEVDCKDCTVRFTNSSGTTDEEEGVYGGWKKTIQANGNVFIDITAQPNGDDPDATVRLYVNGTYIAGERSSGHYLAASASCRPRDYYDKK